MEDLLAYVGLDCLDDRSFFEVILHGSMILTEKEPWKLTNLRENQKVRLEKRVGPTFAFSIFSPVPKEWSRRFLGSGTYAVFAQLVTLLSMVVIWLDTEFATWTKPHGVLWHRKFIDSGK